MYIVIECHGGLEYATICLNLDGTNVVFETEAEAMLYAEDCQDGMIVEADK